jgi:hypothetical protein
MKKEIRITSDDGEITIKTWGHDYYRLEHGEIMSIEFTEAQLLILKYMIDEIIQHNKKQDY